MMLGVDTLDIARWQFGVTTVYHFLMVPLTIGLSLLVAGMQTAWVVTGRRRFYAMTKFWGKLMLINFAMGVVTGIVQEFQFGLNWSDYSRFVGDVFGAPLAMEGLIAFFIESTFLGLWIFGWERLPKSVHLACIWATAIASTLSAYFILAANSWMQHPVGIAFVGGRPRLTSIWAVLTNNTVLAAFPHTIAGSFQVAGAFLLGIGLWQLIREHRRRTAVPATAAAASGSDTVSVGRSDSVSAAAPGTEPGTAAPESAAARTARVEEDHRPVWRSSVWLGVWVSVLAFAAVALTGDTQGKLMFQQQPMKMAAAEALCHTEAPASFSVFAVGSVDRPDCESVKSITVPALLSFLAHNDFHTKVYGVQDLISQYQAKYGTNYPVDPALGALSGKPINYVPQLPVTYWGFRLMIGFGGLAALAALLAGWLIRRGRTPRNRWIGIGALLVVGMPFLANSFGWIFTELGRQPFVVAPNPTGVPGVWLFTAQAVSPGVSPTEALISFITLTSVYAVLAVVELFLLARYIRAGVPGVLPPEPAETPSDDVLAFAY